MTNPASPNNWEAAKFDLENCLEEGVELEGGVVHGLDEIEELRLMLQSLMNKNLLDSLLFLYKELNKEPRGSEMYSWFIRNSQYGKNCRYAMGALKRFKKDRVDNLVPLLERALEACKELKAEDSSF